MDIWVQIYEKILKPVKNIRKNHQKSAKKCIISGFLPLGAVILGQNATKTLSFGMIENSMNFKLDRLLHIAVNPTRLMEIARDEAIAGIRKTNAVQFSWKDGPFDIVGMRTTANGHERINDKGDFTHITEDKGITFFHLLLIDAKVMADTCLPLDRGERPVGFGQRTVMNGRLQFLSGSLLGSTCGKESHQENKG